MRQGKTGIRAVASATATIALALAVLHGATSPVAAQGATDTATEGQVRQQIIQNPIIPAISDPEPKFTTAKQDAILSRPRPEYDEIGLEAGGLFFDIEHLGRGQPLESFLLFPQVDVGLTFDDNIFATQNGRVADFIGSIKPSLSLRSNWDNHEIFAEAHGRFTRNLSNSRESVREHGFSTGGKLEISEFEFIRASLGFDRKTTVRGDVREDVGGNEPGVFYQTGLNATWQYQRDKFLWRARGGVTHKNFVDVPAGVGEIETDQNDRIEYDASVRLGWEEWEGTTLFVQPDVGFTRFIQKVDNTGVERNFGRYGILAGFTYDLTAVTFLEGALGFGLATFADPNSDDFFFVDASLDFVWNPHDSWTFKAGFERDVTATNAVTNVNGVNVSDVATISNELSLAAQLEVTYELLAANELGFRRSETVAGNTIDNVLANELSLLWLMNENMRMRGFWQFTLFSSNDANREFLRNRLGVVLTLHY
ncbi:MULTISPECIES: outer membrane beta-barrel protein [unclassified Minwuia]|uniref:outer membrane beta-barrel protein n=1 Tax=unclassified Minwuia TaxID=2618799 RepID=UPI00247A8FB1|nr:MULTISPECIES: outer membrane beta-barrel protein [unclassified Minwuia]